MGSPDIPPPPPPPAPPPPPTATATTVAQPSASRGPSRRRTRANLSSLIIRRPSVSTGTSKGGANV